MVKHIYTIIAYSNLFQFRLSMLILAPVLTRVSASQKKRPPKSVVPSHRSGWYKVVPHLDGEVK